MQSAVEVLEVWIDADHRLCVRPSEPMNHVYRSAMEVHWDAAGAFLYSPPPREWTYARWAQQIIAAVESEYALQLTISSGTIWGIQDATVLGEVRAVFG